ncbi:MAG: CPBP family intramembrane glutamic endopeptidase [Ferruginibacter sp.]
MQTSDMMIYAFCYAMVFVLAWISRINNSERLFTDEGELTSKPGSLTGIHLIGIACLGLVPVILLKLSAAHVLFGNTTPRLPDVLTFSILLLLVIAIAFKQSEQVTRSGKSPGEIFQQLSSSFFTRYFIIRSLFLFVYELWFRGFLLSESISWLGIPAAVSLNVFLYTLLHIFKSKKEILVCIPFGLIVCLLCLFFNGAWPAVIIHIGFSFVYEFNIYQTYLNTSKTVRS